MVPAAASNPVDKRAMEEGSGTGDVLGIWLMVRESGQPSSGDREKVPSLKVGALTEPVNNWLPYSFKKEWPLLLKSSSPPS